MNLKKTLVIPLVLVAALGAGTALSGCVEVQTGKAAQTSRPSEIPADIPLLNATGNSSSFNNKNDKTYTYNLDTAETDAVKAAGDLLASSGFTTNDSKNYSNSKYTVRLSGGGKKLTYNIAEK